MRPANCPLTVYRGDTYRWKFVFWSNADRTEPADLTSATPKAEIRDRPGGRLVATLETVLTEPNVIEATLDAANSGNLPHIAVWDLQLSYEDGDVFTPIAGPVVVLLDVTDSAR